MARSIFILLLAALACCKSARILGVFPLPSKSHWILGSALLKELAHRGHEVTMISPFPVEHPIPNYRDVRIDSMASLKKTSPAFARLANPGNSVMEKLKAYIDIVADAEHTFFTDKDVVNFLESKPKFDVVIQLWTYGEAFLGIGNAVGAPVIGFNIMGGFPTLNYHAGLPHPYSYVPNLYSQFTERMDIWERVQNTLIHLGFDFYYTYWRMPEQDKILHQYFPQAPPLSKLLDDVDLHLVASNIAIESARPYLPNTIQIGGFHLIETEVLSKDLKQFMDNSKNGVILFSLGTNVQTSKISKDLLNTFVKVFSKSKYDFLLKLDNDLGVKAKNIKISTWLPQRAVLAHPKTKAFISHGGLGSVIESVYNSVPVICIPFVADQNKNAADGELNGFIYRLELDNVAEETVDKAIREITENPKYLESAKMRGDILKNQPMNPMDKAVYWVEHVIKYKGAKHLKSRATELPLYQYLLLDVFAIIGSVITVCLAIVYIAVKSLLRVCCRSEVLQAKPAKKKLQ